MRHRIATRHRHRADIYEWVDDPAGGQELDLVHENVACAFDAESTQFVREDTGEHVQKPAEIRLSTDIDVSEGMIVEVNPKPDVQYEIRGIDPAVDALRGREMFNRCELERFD